MSQQVGEVQQTQLLTPTHLFPESFGGRPLDGQLGAVRHLPVRLGQAEVADLCHGVIRDQHITSGQISVNQLLGLQVLHPLTHITKKTKKKVRGVAMTLDLCLK